MTFPLRSSRPQSFFFTLCCALLFFSVSCSDDDPGVTDRGKNNNGIVDTPDTSTGDIGQLDTGEPECSGDGECQNGVCRDGECVAASCEDISCGNDEVCYRGACYDYCETVTDCEGESRCFDDHCAPFDCGGILCAAQEFCVRGVCYPPCGNGEENPCPALDFVTSVPRGVESDSALLEATIIELPLDPVTDHGFCWHTSTNPSLERGQCHSLGAPEELGRFEHQVTDLIAGRIHYVRAYVADGVDTFYANEVEFTTGAAAPSDVTATQGTHADYVEVSWWPRSGATGYIVYRDGVAVGNVGDSTLSYQDTGADPATGLGEPTGVSATRGDHTDRVEISWNAATNSDNATRHDYTVVANYPALSSSPSAPTTGYRAAGEVLSYELQIDDGAWFDVGLVTSYADIGSGAGTIAPGVSSASEGEHADWVALELTGASASPGATASYKVRALTSQGTSPASQPITGYRGVGALQYQWQRSAGDADGGYGDLAGATTTTHEDTGAPSDGSGRYYRVRITSEGTTPQNSAASRGFRAVAPMVSTTSVSDIAASSATFDGTLGSLGVPAATVHGFCWATTTNPSTESQSGAVCQSLGAPSNTGPFTLPVSTLTPGTSYFVRAYGTNNAGTAYGDNIAFVTPPASPTGVSASNGTSANYVRVTWSAAAGADEYRVFRDGVLVATVNSTTFDDTDATPGGLPAAPSLTATSGDHTDRVALNWNAPTAADGSTHSYTVVAIREGTAGAESSPDTGYRAAYPISTYELQIDAGQWVEIGQTLNFDDTDAPAGAINPGVASASSGTFTTHVALGLTGAGASDGASRSYRVRAKSAAGTGNSSSPTPGYRGVGEMSIQWERSGADSDAGYTNLAGATALAYEDTSAPSNGAARYYRVAVNAAGASSAYSNAARGFRAALPALTTGTPEVDGAQVTLHGDITSLGAPNPSAHGFCWGTSMNPDIGESGDTICDDLGATSQTGTFSHLASNVTPNTTYYARAFATTNAGTAYGANATFEVDWAGVRTFNNCGQTGRTGPSQSQCNTQYGGTTLQGEVTLQGGIQLWTVPATGTYRIEAWGAQGGASTAASRVGGRGARLRGDFQLTQGETIQILVGQRGINATGTGQAGGGSAGGGSFVVKTGGEILLIAGGGGGAQHYNTSHNGGPGQTSTSGQGGDGTCAGAGGINGAGGIACGNTGYHGGSGAGGYSGNGTATSGSSSWGTICQGGVRFTAGGLGGLAGSQCRDGGFGGGGAGGFTGGGGGGYSGGGGGGYSSNTRSGGGGGSYNVGTNQDNTANVNTGDGQVTIDLL